GGLEMNFAIGREKANNISRAETSYEGLELAISETEPSPPTGGTKTSKNHENSIQYSPLNAHSASVPVHCAISLCHFPPSKWPFSIMKTDGCVETICAITLCHHGEPNPRVHAPQKGGQRSSKRRGAKGREWEGTASNSTLHHQMI
ncbi:MAG: hypothetical protein ACTHLA_15085, partial [Asticcacaulis sp.]|uniref:hypothetical protein n=1 Tax=Asticcacaulis sp. TaxID=1872648 RepID=UPI003F7BFAEE